MICSIWRLAGYILLISINRHVAKRNVKVTVDINRHVAERNVKVTVDIFLIILIERQI